MERHYNRTRPSFDAVMTTVGCEMEADERETEIIGRLDELNRLNRNIEAAVDALNQAASKIGPAMQACELAKERLDGTAAEIDSKIGMIRSHVDQAIEDARKKLRISISVDDPGLTKVNEYFAKERKSVDELMSKHCASIDSMLDHNFRRNIQAFKDSDGCYLGRYIQYVFFVFFFIGVVTSCIAIGKYFGWI